MIRLNNKDTHSWQAQARILVHARGPVRLEEKECGDKKVKVPVLRERSLKQFFLELFVPGEKNKAIRRTYAAINQQVKPTLFPQTTRPNYRDASAHGQDAGPDIIVVEDNSELLCRLQRKAWLTDTSGGNRKNLPYRLHIEPGDWHVKDRAPGERREAFKQAYISEINKSVKDDPGLAMPVVVPFFDKSKGKPNSDSSTKMTHSISAENIQGLADAIKEAKRSWEEQGRLIEPAILSADKAVTSMAAKEEIRIRA